ncbi:MAG TPA: CotD family spore coat protein [Metabacillus sp.]|nr:CotD family spore coat protein [Metabacillus sp.]
MGRRSVYGSDSNGFGGNKGNVAGAFDNGGNDVETIIEPTENIVNTTTNRRTVRRVYLTHIENVNRNCNDC